MRNNLKQYPKNKDINNIWFDTIPSHWSIVRLKNIVKMLVSNVDKHTKEDEIPIRLCNYVDVYKNDRITESLKFMRASAKPDEIEQFKLKFDDILITKDSESWNDIGVPALVEYTADDLVCGYHLAILRPNKSKICGGYLNRLHQCENVKIQYHVNANGVTRYGLSHGSIENIVLPLPPLDEQNAIVRFLDYTDRRIKRYIRAKQKLIKLLEEEKQAIIHQAVTRGFDPDVPMKPSGLDWMGDIPEHWKIRRLKFLAEIKTGGSDTINRKDDGKYPFFVRSQNVERIDTYSYEGEAVLTAGDGAGVAKVFHYYDGKFDFHQRVYRFSKFKQIQGKYFYYYFRNSLKFEAFRETAKSTVDSLRLPLLQNFPIPIPTLKEQDTIVSNLDKIKSGFEKKSNLLFSEIALLQEYRTRLIADVVTGKLDVRAAAAQIPVELEEEPVEEEENEEVIDEEVQEELES